MAARRWIAIAAALAAAALPAVSARANGDPASDVLLQSKVYFPGTQRVSEAEGKRLLNVVQSANAKGYAIRVAIIGDIGDLGTVPDLFNQPQQYAQFLGPEIRFAYKGDLLVVMPDGIGLTTTDETPPPAKAIAGMKVEAGGSPDGMALTAEEAVTALAAAAGHPLTGAASKGGGGGGVLLGIVVAVVLVGVGIGAAFWARRSAPRSGTTPPSAP